MSSSLFSLGLLTSFLGGAFFVVVVVGFLAVVDTLGLGGADCAFPDENDDDELELLFGGDASSTDPLSTNFNVCCTKTNQSVSYSPLLHLR